MKHRPRLPCCTWDHCDYFFFESYEPSSVGCGAGVAGTVFSGIWECDLKYQIYLT